MAVEAAVSGGASSPRASIERTKDSCSPSPPAAVRRLFAPAPPLVACGSFLH